MAEELELKFHEQAEEAFNRSADEILRGLTVRQASPERESSFRPQVFTSVHLTEKDIINLSVTAEILDPSGRVVGRFFRHGQHEVGLAGDNFRAMEDLVERVQCTAVLRSFVSTKFVSSVTFQWLNTRYIGASDQPFSGYVLEQSRQVIRVKEIWLPICRLCIESNLEIGKVQLRTVTKEMLDEWENRMASTVAASGHEAVAEVFRRWRSRLQGYAAVTISVRAEPIRAREIAVEEADRSISLLRFFHSANYFPTRRSYCTLLGREREISQVDLEIEEAKIQSLNHELLTQENVLWKLDDATVAGMRKRGLDILSGLLKKQEWERTDFEEHILSSLLLYVRNNVLEDPSDKLIYILAGLESMLLRDRNEPIQDKIGERLAFWSGTQLRKGSPS